MKNTITEIPITEISFEQGWEIIQSSQKIDLTNLTAIINIQCFYDASYLRKTAEKYGYEVIYCRKMKVPFLLSFIPHPTNITVYNIDLNNFYAFFTDCDEYALVDFLLLEQPSVQLTEQFSQKEYDLSSLVYKNLFSEQKFFYYGIHFDAASESGVCYRAYYNFIPEPLKKYFETSITKIL